MVSLTFFLIFYLSKHLYYLDYYSTSATDCLYDLVLIYLCHRCCVSTRRDVWPGSWVRCHHLCRWGSCCGSVWCQRRRHWRQGWRHGQDGYYFRNSRSAWKTNVQSILASNQFRNVLTPIIIQTNRLLCQYGFMVSVCLFCLVTFWNKPPSHHDSPFFFFVSLWGLNLSCVTQYAWEPKEAGAAPLLLGNWGLSLPCYWVTLCCCQAEGMIISNQLCSCTVRKTVGFWDLVLSFSRRLIMVSLEPSLSQGIAVNLFSFHRQSFWLCGWLHCQYLCAGGHGALLCCWFHLHYVSAADAFGWSQAVHPNS